MRHVKYRERVRRGGGRDGRGDAGRGTSGAGRDGGVADDAADPTWRGASESAGVGRVGGGVGGGGRRGCCATASVRLLHGATTRCRVPCLRRPVTACVIGIRQSALPHPTLVADPRGRTCLPSLTHQHRQSPARLPAPSCRHVEGEDTAVSERVRRGMAGHRKVFASRSPAVQESGVGVRSDRAWLLLDVDMAEWAGVGWPG